jgi:hypothetical protein
VSTGSKPPSSEGGANRKLIRPRLDDHPHWPGTRAANRTRRPAPPSAETGAEAAHFHKQVQLGSVLVVTMEDGTVHRGVLDWYDSEALALRPEEGGEVVVLKQAVLHTARDGAGRRSRSS